MNVKKETIIMFFQAYLKHWTMEDINDILDVARNNLTEDTFAEFEGEATTWLNILCEENISYFHNSNDEREKLINFICMQYFRTVKIRNNILFVLKQAEEIFINDQFSKGCLRAENLVFPTAILVSQKEKAYRKLSLDRQPP